MEAILRFRQSIGARLHHCGRAARWRQSGKRVVASSMKEARLSMIHAPVSRNIVVGGKGTLDQVGFFITGFDSIVAPLRDSLLEKREQARLAEALFASSRINVVESNTSTKVWPEPQRRWFRRPNKLRRIHWLLTPSLLSSSPMPTSQPIPVCRARRLVENARRDAQAVDRAMAELRRLVPHSGSYVSESNYFKRIVAGSILGGKLSEVAGSEGPT